VPNLDCICFATEVFSRDILLRSVIPVQYTQASDRGGEQHEDFDGAAERILFDEDRPLKSPDRDMPENRR
jgi:hypothetical protein